jgi:hypothetical protein
MGDSAHTIHHTTPGMTHCDQKCVSKYLRNTKKLDVSLWNLLHCINLRRENRTGKFPFSAVLITMGQQTNSTMVQTESRVASTKFSTRVTSTMYT